MQKKKKMNQIKKKKWLGKPENKIPFQMRQIIYLNSQVIKYGSMK